jgi:hypothetical protein
MNNKTQIHILKGTGDNCTCHDCIVLYGGECDTTPINNMLDKMEEDIQKFLDFTPTGRKKKPSRYAIESAVETIIKPMWKKYSKSKVDFYSKFHIFSPLVYFVTSQKKNYDSYYYKRTRALLLDLIEEDFNKVV